MKIVRFQIGKEAKFGILEMENIVEIEGSIFGAFRRSSRTYKLSEVRLLAPVTPSKIICIGLNFRDHIEELGRDVPFMPSHFLKPPTALVGPDDPIVYPRVAKRVDYEGELAVVIKDRIRDVTEEEAVSHVLGCTCFNDVTERTLSEVPGQLTRSKGFDTFAPIGPCIDTDVDPSRAVIRTYLNGKLVQEGSTEETIFSVPYLIHFLSQCMTLLPGDVISTGTPKGVGPIRPGDVVEVSIEGVGTLRNPVRSAS
jgi:2-keto-4-pentenoate hydratase/2-oxohepta-3-ene-1,7-dioic acid hydratase in catechol pathway